MVIETENFHGLSHRSTPVTSVWSITARTVTTRVVTAVTAASARSSRGHRAAGKPAGSGAEVVGRGPAGTGWPNRRVLRSIRAFLPGRGWGSAEQSAAHGGVARGEGPDE